MRICNKCKKEKPLTDFYKDRSNASGYSYRCKECKRIQQNKYHENNREAKRDYMEKYRKENPHIQKLWKQKNPDYMKNHYAENKEIYHNNMRKWRMENRNRAAGYSRAYRARKAEVKNDLTEEEWFGIINHFGNSCAYCGNNTDITLDHVIPISKGGDHSKNNVVPACMSCNASKQARDVEEWYSKQDFYDENNLNKIIEENE